MEKQKYGRAVVYSTLRCWVRAYCRNAEKISNVAKKFILEFPLGERKLLINTGGTLYLPSKSRNILADTMKPAKITKAAFVINNHLAKIIASIFMRANSDDFVMKVFGNVENARKWLNE